MTHRRHTNHHYLSRWLTVDIRITIASPADSLSTYESSLPLQMTHGRPTNHYPLSSWLTVDLRIIIASPADSLSTYESSAPFVFNRWSRVDENGGVPYLNGCRIAPFKWLLWNLSLWSAVWALRYFISTSILISWKALLNVWYTNSLCAYMLIAPTYKSISLTTNMLG